MFSKLKEQVKTQFNNLVKDQLTLFYINIDREKIWESYLNGFTDPIEKQGHNCNCCKSFLRQYAGIVVIKDNKIISIWDVKLEDIDELYRQSIKNIQDYIHSLPITDVFYNSFSNLGTDKNLDKEANVTWQHFQIALPSAFIKNNDTIPTLLGEKRDLKAVLKRGLDELTDDACQTVLELISQNSLYRGNEFEPMVKEFFKLKQEYKNIPNELKNNFTWIKSTTIPQYVSKIRNSAIGTLLIDLSNGDDLDKAVSAFERVVAPTNYKRPTSLITPRMIEDAKKKIEELGFLNSLDRRFANTTDINVNNLLFVDRSSELKDVFQELQKETTINIKSLSKVEEITIDDFINNVIPKAKSIEVCLENSHLNSFVSLLSSVNKDSPSMFKWNNPISWSYTGGITDSIKERVKAAGGKVEGDLRVSLSWFNHDDLDLHVLEPDGTRINFRNKISYQSGGHLDVDMNAGGGYTRTPVENIIWTNKSKMREGTYTVEVNNFALRESNNSGFIVEVEFNGEIFNFEQRVSPRNKETKLMVEITYSKTKGFSVKGDAKSSVISKDKWNVKTNQFTKVKSIMLSPNYWENKIGNKHFIFILDGCVSDEKPRGFFNEFLKDDLTKDRKVFEVLASKLSVESTVNQLSGVGFSETQRNHLIVRVEGTFKRNLKINF